MLLKVCVQTDWITGSNQQFFILLIYISYCLQLGSFCFCIFSLLMGFDFWYVLADNLLVLAGTVCPIKSLHLLFSIV